MCVGALSPAFPKIYLFSNLLTRFGVHIHLSISVHVPSVPQVMHSLWAGCLLPEPLPTCTTTRMFPFPSISLRSHAGFCCIYSCITALSFGELIALIFVLFLFYFMVLGLAANLISMSMYFYWILLTTIFFPTLFLLFSWHLHGSLKNVGSSWPSHS